jgi:lycopene cyclase domain-containing protein
VIRASYLLVLAFCLVGTAPLELVLRVHVYARWRRLLRAVLPVCAVFVGWDVLAIRAGHWRYDLSQMTGVVLPGRLPLEELLFFLVVPTCCVLTLEAVRKRRPGWRIGDEP